MKRTVFASFASVFALPLTGALVLALQGAVAPAYAYDINMVLPLTGGAAFLGKEEQKALQLAEPVINKAGGIHGQHVHFIFYDGQSNPQTGGSAHNRIVAAKPAVLLGSSLVAVCNAMAALMQNGPTMYCFSPGVHPAKGDLCLYTCVSTGDLADAQIRYFRLKGWTRLAIMTSADATGQDAEHGLDAVVAPSGEQGHHRRRRAHFNTTDVSVAAQIEHIKAANPQALIAWSTGSPIATVFKGIVQAGLDIPIATTNGNMTYAQMTQYAAFLPKQLYIPTSEWVQHAGVITLDPGGGESATAVFRDVQGRQPQTRPSVDSGLGSGHDPRRRACAISAPKRQRSRCAISSPVSRALPASTASMTFRKSRSAGLTCRAP